MAEAHSTIDPRFASALFRSVRIEALLGLALGTSGGLLKSAALSTSLLGGGLLGATFGLAFGLFFARRATSPGAGLIWGLGSSFLLWILTAGGFFHFVETTGRSGMMLQDVQGHFPELVGYLLCLGMPVGTGLGLRGALRLAKPNQKFSWGRAIVAGGFAG